MERVRDKSGIRFLGYASSSAIRIMDILIDIGCSIKAIEEDEAKYGPIKAVFLTHHHTDHVNESTLKWFSNSHSNIVIYANKTTRDYFHYIPIRMLRPGQKTATQKCVIIPTYGIHDTPVYIYEVTTRNPESRWLEDRYLVVTDSALDNSVVRPRWKHRVDYLIAEYKYREDWLAIFQNLTTEGADKLREYHHKEPTGEPLTDEDFQYLKNHASKEQIMKLWEWVGRGNCPLIRINARATLYCDE